MQHRTNTRIHPHTGLPLEPVYVTKHGVPRYPILGASEDNGGTDSGPGNGGNGDGGNGDGGNGDGGNGDGGTDSGSGDGGDGSVDDSGDSGQADDADHGFPKDTAIKDMTDAQRAAYWEHHSKKHERAWQSKRLVEMTPEQLREVLDENDKLKRSQMSENERALEDARAEGERIGREAAVSERRDASLTLIGTLIEKQLEHRSLKREDHSDFLDSLDHTKFLLPDGSVDTDKVARVVGGALPTGNGRSGGNRQGPDMGQGNRGGGSKSSGVDAGADLFDRLHKK